MKKIVAIIILCLFSWTTSGVWAVTDEISEIKKAVFDDNAQDISDAGFEKAMNLSPIEKLFNDKDAEISGKPLRQMGYDLFSSSAIVIELFIIYSRKSQIYGFLPENLLNILKNKTILTQKQRFYNCF